MTLYDIVSGLLSVMLWGTMLCLAGVTIRCIAIYGPEWRAMRRAQKEERRRMEESLREGRGLRASEMGGNDE